MSTFAGSRKTNDLQDGSVVAVTIDSESFPYRSLSIRGPVFLREVSGLSAEYQTDASRYLGEKMGKRWLDFVGDPDQVVMTLQPTMAVASDLGVESGFFSS